ncbi:MAG: ParB/RepB/Spo0J family partition protein [Candidatus Aminicenantes bacterium]|nr:ParB/RepB/Spo0J family partition protein [Candidatus Aminicenantes bacterium]
MKKALGKGIKAFIPEEYGILKEESFTELDIDLLSPSPFQPRMRFDEHAIDELAQSIRETGILQPIIAVPAGGRYNIIIGERRWRAAQKVGLRKVPVILRNIPKERQMEASVIENVQREDLNPIEIAHSYKGLIEILGYSQEEVADKVGKDRASVANTLRLLNLPETVQGMLAQEKISMGHARAILGIEDPKGQIEAAKWAAESGRSVRETEDYVNRRRKKRAPRRTKIDPDLESLQEDLLQYLGAKVAISGTPKKGTIKISYFSLGELNRIYDLIKGVRS